MSKVRARAHVSAARQGLGGLLEENHTLVVRRVLEAQVLLDIIRAVEQLVDDEGTD
jgi:hypothetical protein